MDQISWELHTPTDAPSSLTVHDMKPVTPALVSLPASPQALTRLGRGLSTPVQMNQLWLKWNAAI